MATKSKKNKTIVLPIAEENYSAFIEDPSTAHEIVQDFLNRAPELFPSETLEKGYIFKGKDRVSQKMGIQLRRVQIAGEIYRIRPSFVMPYMRAKSKDVEHALLLIRYGVPFWVIAVVFGRNPMYWYRLFIGFAQFNIVGTTVYEISRLPKHLLADEFHIRIKGVKAYVATIIASACFLGAEVCAKADEMTLRKAYGVFKAEVQALLVNYQPFSINTDGWFATQNALQFLFDKAKIVECYLHAVIKVRDRATKKLKAQYQVAVDKVWNIYRTVSKRQMGQQIRRLREWTVKTLPECAMKDNLLKLCKKKGQWLAHFDAPEAHRTSAHLDRVMKIMERHAINSQMFHASVSSTSMNFRALALLYNFSPSCPAVTKKYPELVSPAARLNGFVYSKSWLENLLTAASLNGFKT